MPYAKQRSTYELVVWVACMELTIQVRAINADDARGRVLRELGPKAVVLTTPKWFSGSTSRPFATKPPVVPKDVSLC